VVLVSHNFFDFAGRVECSREKAIAYCIGESADHYWHGIMQQLSFTISLELAQSPLARKIGITNMPDLSVKKHHAF